MTQDDRRLPTGIPGFDKLVEGGFVKHSVNLITGGTGTGKTIFAVHWLVNQVQSGRKALFISFEENLDPLLGDALLFGWDLQRLQAQGKVVMSTLKPMASLEVNGEFSQLIRQNNISIVVIDSISIMAMAFQGNLYKMRKEFSLLTDTLKKLGCTTLFTAEMPSEASTDLGSNAALSRDGVIEFIADSVITLHNVGIGGQGDRALRIVKMRRTVHKKDPVPLQITKKGIVVKS